MVGVATCALGPVEYLVFRRVGKRAERVGGLQGRVVGKLMCAQEDARMRFVAVCTGCDRRLDPKSESL